MTRSWPRRSAPATSPRERSPGHSSRGGIYSTVFTVTMTVLGYAESAWVILCIPIALLIGFTFASLGMAGTTFMRSWTDFDYVFISTMPLFLFSGSFFPLSRYSPVVRVIVQCTPLYHGVELSRSAASGRWDPGAAVNVAYLLVAGFAGLIVASRRIEKLLLP